MKLGQSKPFLFALIMFIIASFSAGALTVVNQVTKDRIAAQEAAKYEQYLNGAFGTKKATVETIGFSDANGKVVSKYIVPGKGTGYVLVGKGGYKGDVKMFVILNDDKTVNTKYTGPNFQNSNKKANMGIFSIAHSETKGKWEKVFDNANEKAALSPQHYSFFGGNPDTDGLGNIAQSSYTSTSIRNAFRSLYYCFDGGDCK